MWLQPDISRQQCWQQDSLAFSHLLKQLQFTALDWDKKFTCVNDFFVCTFRAISTMPTGPLLVKFGGMSKVSEISFNLNDDKLQVGSCALYSNSWYTNRIS